MVSIHQNMEMNDELAALFSRNLTFNPELQAPVQQAPAPEPAQPIIYSVSQHYTHSAHVVKAQQGQQQEAREEPQRHSSEPPQSESLNAETVLRNHGVDPNTLTPSQVQLFRIADEPQQLRLLELWSICPPGNGGDIPALAWSSTTVEQEEQLAHMRYERAQQEQQQQQQQSMTLDTAAYQTGDGRWVESDNDSEPYMLSGYEEMMRREQQRQELESRLQDVHSHFSPAYTPATDPVYMGPDYIRQKQMMDMATQYGAFQQFRGGPGEVDAMDVM